MTLLTRARPRIGRIFHVQHPVMKHVENSLRGVKKAFRLHYDAIDIDLLITEADPHCPLPDNDPEHVNGECLGHIAADHWDRPMVHDGFHDPEHKIPRYTPVRRMTWPQLARLVAPGGYRIKRIGRILRACTRRRRIALLEPKDDPRFALDWPWQYLAKVAEDLGCTASVRALPQNAAALAPARRAGFKAWEIR